MLGSVLESTSSWAVDKGKTTVRAFTANGAGTSTTIVGANAQASAASLKVGDRVRLYVAANTLKDILLFTITNIAVAGSTTITFTPATTGAVATASTDYISQSLDISDITTTVSYADIASLDARLLAIGGAFTQLRLNSMTVNDKFYALRLADDSEMV